MQIRWMEFVANYDLNISYHPRKGNVVADALSLHNAEEDLDRDLEVSEPLRMQSVNQEGLFQMIQEEQKEDVDLKRIIKELGDSSETKETWLPYRIGWNIAMEWEDSSIKGPRFSRRDSKDGTPFLT